MPEKRKLGKGGLRKHGRKLRKPTHLKYNSERRREHNKLRRVLKSNGQKAALAYAREHRMAFRPSTDM